MTQKHKNSSKLSSNNFFEGGFIKLPRHLLTMPSVAEMYEKEGSIGGWLYIVINLVLVTRLPIGVSCLVDSWMLLPAKCTKAAATSSTSSWTTKICSSSMGTNLPAIGWLNSIKWNCMGVFRKLILPREHYICTRKI